MYFLTEGTSDQVLPMGIKDFTHGKSRHCIMTGILAGIAQLCRTSACRKLPIYRIDLQYPHNHATFHC